MDLVTQIVLGAAVGEVVLGKKVWEDNNCIGCHTLLGEGAYFAPELGNDTPDRHANPFWGNC